MQQTLNSIGRVIILASLHVSMAWADNRTGQNDINWFSSGTSSLLNHSSVALGSKRINRGLRFAHQALAGKLNPVDEFIAYHNLCIGHLAADSLERASQPCAHAVDLAQGAYTIVRLRGTLRIQRANTENDTVQGISSPLQVMINHIRRQNTQARLSLLFKLAPMFSNNDRLD